MNPRQFRSSVTFAMAGAFLIAVFSSASAADSNPAHVAPGLAAALRTFTDNAHTRLVWVQKQFISDDTTRFLWCGGYFDNWLSNGGSDTKLVGFDTREGAGRILDSTRSTHVRPIIDRTGNFVMWTETESSQSWVMSWDGTVKKSLLKGGAYIVLCTWYDRASGKEYVYFAEDKNCNDYGCEVKNVYRYEFDFASASIIPETKLLQWNKTEITAPFNVAADGIHAGSCMPWPDAHIAELPNGSLIKLNGADQWSCFSQIAPDASLRFFHFEPGHRSIYAYGPSHTNPSIITMVPKMPGAKAGTDCEAPRWTNHVSFMTVGNPLGFYYKLDEKCNSPVNRADWAEGEIGEFFLGKFNSSFNDLQFVRITDGDWRFRKVVGDAWLSTGEGPDATAAASAKVAHQSNMEPVVVGMRGGIRISLPTHGDFSANILSVNGRTTRNIRGTDGSAQLANLPPGTYWISVAGKGIATRHLVVVK